MKAINKPKKYLKTDIKLDVGCGFHKEKGWVGIDIRPVPTADIIHDIESTPWPLLDNSCQFIRFSHIMEHVNPKYMIDIFDEMWRLLMPGCDLMVETPYAGSHGAYQDPTHVRPGFNETTFTYYDPSHNLYQVYKPKPWKIIRCDYRLESNILVIMKVMKSSLRHIKVA